MTTADFAAYDSRLRPVLHYILERFPYNQNQIASFSLAEMCRAMLEECLLDEPRSEPAIRPLITICDTVSQDNQNQKKPKTKKCPISKCEVAR